MPAVTTGNRREKSKIYYEGKGQIKYLFFDFRE